MVTGSELLSAGRSLAHYSVASPAGLPRPRMPSPPPSRAEDRAFDSVCQKYTLRASQLAESIVQRGHGQGRVQAPTD